MIIEREKPKGVYCNLKQLIKVLSEVYWDIDIITRRHKGNLDDCWVTLPFLDKLNVTITKLVETGEVTLEELKKKSEEFRLSIMSGLEK